MLNASLSKYNLRRLKLQQFNVAKGIHFGTKMMERTSFYSFSKVLQKNWNFFSALMRNSSMWNKMCELKQHLHATHEHNMDSSSMCCALCVLKTTTWYFHTAECLVMSAPDIYTRDNTRCMWLVYANAMLNVLQAKLRIRSAYLDCKVLRSVRMPQQWWKNWCRK